jgi:hypothetical protein
VQIHKYAAGCGAEVHGVQLASLDDNELEALRKAFREHGLLFFRDQQLAPADHLAFAQCWGPIVQNKFFPEDAEYPEIAEVAVIQSLFFSAGIRRSGKWVEGGGMRRGTEGSAERFGGRRIDAGTQAPPTGWRVRQNGLRTPRRQNPRVRAPVRDGPVSGAEDGPRDPHSPE